MKLFYPPFLVLFFFTFMLSCTPEPDREVNRKPSNGLSSENKSTPSEPTVTKNAPGLKEDYTHTNRVIWQKPDMVIDRLGDLSEKTIADIGAGTGFFALRLTPLAEKVIATDIDPLLNAYIDSIKVLELPENIQDKLETRLAGPMDPKLEKEEVDIVVIVNTFMWIPGKAEYLARLKDGIKDGGQLVIIDFKKKRTPLGPENEYRLPLFELEQLLYDAGYTLISTDDTSLDYQYIVFAEK